MKGVYFLPISWGHTLNQRRTGNDLDKKGENKQLNYTNDLSHLDWMVELSSHYRCGHQTSFCFILCNKYLTLVKVRTFNRWGLITCWKCSAFGGYSLYEGSTWTFQCLPLWNVGNIVIMSMCMCLSVSTISLEPVYSLIHTFWKQIQDGHHIKNFFNTFIQFIYLFILFFI